jgi:hypothetical protein
MMEDTNKMDSALAEEAMNVAIKHIQDKLGVKSGDLAGQFFADEDGDTMLTILYHYIKTERSFGDMLKEINR